MIDLNEQQSKLFEHKVYNAWQFVLNTYQTIECADYAKSVVDNILVQMGNDHDQFQENMYKTLSETKHFALTEDNFPATKIDVVGVETDAHFLLNMLIKDVFQYSRNAFDSMSQISNAALLANKSKKVDTIDFPKMLSVFAQQTYSSAFPDMDTWYQGINSSLEFEYLDAFCNRTKHTLDVFTKVSMDIFGDKKDADINPFYRKEKQLDKKDVGQFLTQVVEYTKTSFENFLDIVLSECVKDLFNGDRYHKVKVTQYKMKDYEQSFVYIEDARPVDSLPDEIYLLFTRKDSEGLIEARNAPMDRILVMATEHPQEFSCRYIAETEIGDDKMLIYRKYAKDSTTGIHMMVEELQRKPVFYHANPYMDIKAVADEENEGFLRRVQLPF